MKKFIAILLSMALVASLTACSSGSSDSGSSDSGSSTSTETAAAEAASDTAEASSDSGDTIKIGYIGDLTGETALWGQAGLNGAEIAVQDINDAGGVLGGRMLELVPMDGKGDPADSVSALRSLIEGYGIVAEVGTNFSSCNIPMAAVADELKVPIIATAASNEQVTVDENGNLHPYSFRLCFIDPFMGTVVGAYAHDTLGYNTAALLTVAGNTYSEGIGDCIKETFEAAGGEVTAEIQCQDSDTDFRAILTTLRSNEPDVLFIIMTDYSAIALVAQQAREIGLQCAFMGTDGWDSTQLADQANGTLEGSYYLSRIGFNSDEGKEFGVRYQEIYGDDVDLESECLLTYDGIRWIADAIERAGSDDPTAVRDALEATEVFSSFNGDMILDPETHNPAMDCGIFKCVDGQFEFYEIVHYDDVMG